LIHAAGCAQATKVMRVAKITRLLKVVKMLRLPLLMQQLEEIVGRALLRMVSFITAAMMLIHWVACIFYAVSSIHPNQKTTWIYQSHLQGRDVFDRSARVPSHKGGMVMGAVKALILRRIRQPQCSGIKCCTRGDERQYVQPKNRLRIILYGIVA
jgi:hypothetical protein